MRFVVEVPHEEGRPGEGGFDSAERALRDAVARAGPELTYLALRIEEEDEDLLYSLPVRAFEPALAALPADVEGFRRGQDDGFRSWFRGRWMGMGEEFELTEEEIRAAPLPAERILDLLDPPEPRDWRPVQSCLERRAKCDDLVRAMDLATTTVQRRRLAYLFSRRRRPCGGAIPHLIRWLDDPDPQLAHDAADGLGAVIVQIRSVKALAAAQRAAGPPLLRYARAHPDHFVLTSLGVTAHPPARPYLEQLVAHAERPETRESAALALRNFERFTRAASSDGR